MHAHHVTSQYLEAKNTEIENFRVKNKEREKSARIFF